MASPDTVILLIVDYHAAIGGKTPVPLPYVYTPLLVDRLDGIAFFFPRRPELLKMPPAGRIRRDPGARCHCNHRTRRLSSRVAGLAHSRTSGRLLVRSLRLCTLEV